MTNTETNMNLDNFIVSENKILKDVCFELSKIAGNSNIKIKNNDVGGISQDIGILGEMSIDNILPSIYIFDKSKGREYTLMFNCDDKFINAFCDKDDKVIYRNIDKFCWNYLEDIQLNKEEYIYINGELYEKK